MKKTGVLIVGGGHAGAQAAIALRANGYIDDITIVGDEYEYPYERPPLSKEYMSGEKTIDRLLIKPKTYWADKNVEMILGKRVEQVHPSEKFVGLDDGSTLAYRDMIWAAGGTPRKLSCNGSDLSGIHYIRNRHDVDRITAALPSTNNVTIIGGGYIGLEAAAVFSKLGKKVTVIEAQDRVLARVAGEPLSRYFEYEHASHGVNIMLNTGVSEINGLEGKVISVTTTMNKEISTDMIIVGIGIIPSVKPLTQAGASGHNGVAIDECSRTNLDNIYAIGDCAHHANRYANFEAIRLESVQNASDMATHVAKIIVGENAEYNTVPWFWSNQYDIKLQTVGLSIGHDEVVLRGSPESRSFSVVYLKEGKIIALDCVNRVKDFVQGKALVCEGARIPAEDLKLEEIPLKELALRRQLAV